MKLLVYRERRFVSALDVVAHALPIFVVSFLMLVAWMPVQTALTVTVLVWICGIGIWLYLRGHEFTITGLNLLGRPIVRSRAPDRPFKDAA